MSIHSRLDPDETLVVLFKHLAVENPQKTLAEGRPIFDDIEVCEIRAAGMRCVAVTGTLPPDRLTAADETVAGIDQAVIERILAASVDHD